MAFTTEFVMGAGGGVEEIPVSMSGGGGGPSSPTAYPLTTVDAGDGAFIAVGGTMSTTSLNPAHLDIGGIAFADARVLLTGPAVIPRPAGYVTGTVSVAVLSRNSSATTFTGTVYVYRL